MSAADKYPIPTVQQIEEAVGMGAAGWDMVDPNSIIDAVIRLSAPTQGADARPVASADVLAAVDRMCMPLDDSRLTGVTAQEDARCMKLIRDFVYATRDAVPSDSNLKE